MPSPLGHAMAGAITAWAAEGRRSRAGAPAPRSSSLLDRLADAFSPLTVACAVLAVAPDFDVFFHTHRTYSHSLGAAAIVWGVVAVIAWRLRLPVLRTATVCAAAYASHVLLDWLGRDDRGLMALWPFSTADYRSGLDLFLEFTVISRRRWGIVSVLLFNVPTLARELLVFGLPFGWMLGRKLRREAPKGIAGRARSPQYE